MQYGGDENAIPAKPVGGGGGGLCIKSHYCTVQFNDKNLVLWYVGYGLKKLIFKCVFSNLHL